MSNLQQIQTKPSASESSGGLRPMSVEQKRKKRTLDARRYRAKLKTDFFKYEAVLERNRIKDRARRPRKTPPPISAERVLSERKRADAIPLVPLPSNWRKAQFGCADAKFFIAWLLCANAHLITIARGTTRRKSNPDQKVKDAARNKATPERRKVLRQEKLKDPEYLALTRKRGMDYFFANRQARYDYANSPAVRERNRPIYAKYNRDRREVDPQWVMQNRLRSRMAHALRQQRGKKSSKTYDLIGCSIDELCLHLEQQFKPGMSWENRELWHVDHIRPCAKFDLTDESQQRQCFHYTNLQPLWAAENISKSDS